MKLHFHGKSVLAAIAEAENTPSIRALYGKATGPGLWLAGDHGVYLMPNVVIETPTIVYARECDPETLDFDTWWANKRASFGGDDGIEFIPLSHFDAHARRALAVTDLVIDITPHSFTVMTGAGRR